MKQEKVPDVGGQVKVFDVAFTHRLKPDCLPDAA